MAEDPPAYHCLYDHVPFEKHPERCPCIYHQVDGDLLLKQAHEAEWTDWSYAHYNHPDQLTRESIIDYFCTRENWARIHASWLERDQHQTNVVEEKTISIAASNERNQSELDYRAAFVGLPNREDYDRNWREWQAYIREMDELLEPKGALRRCQVVWRLLNAKVKEAGELYKTFWDLEEAQGSCISRVRMTGCQASSLPRQAPGSSAIADGTLDGVEASERSEKNLKDLRANLKMIQTLKRKLIHEEAVIGIVCERAPPPPWLGGLTAPQASASK